jgi:hypothetical protein
MVGTRASGVNWRRGVQGDMGAGWSLVIASDKIYYVKC